MKINPEIKELVKKHHNAVAKISDLEKEIQNLKIAKESLQIQIENQLWDLNFTEGGGSEVFDATFAIDNVDNISVVSFCKSSIARTEGIVHYPTPRMIRSEN